MSAGIAPRFPSDGRRQGGVASRNWTQPDFTTLSTGRLLLLQAEPLSPGAEMPHFIDTAL